MYQIHNEQGDIQCLTTMRVFNHDETKRVYRKYLAWLAIEGNEPLPMAEPQEPVVDENEEKIKAELRKMAIANLGDELPADYK